MLQGGEELIIDGVTTPKHRPSRPRISEDLYGELRAGDKVHQVHAHIGYTLPWGRIGCLIWIDGILVGGDIGKTFLT